MDSEQLKTSSLWWLRLIRRCPLLVFEFGFEWCARPDVYGIDERRFAVEVEVKVSAADLKRELCKQKYSRPATYRPGLPRQFYLCVPADLVDLAMQIKRPEWGVLYPNGSYWAVGVAQLTCKAVAKPDPNAERLTKSRCLKLVARQSIMLADAMATNFLLRESLSLVAQQLKERKEKP